MSDKYKEPSINSDAFNCPHCDAFAHQEWYDELIAKRNLGQGRYQTHHNAPPNLSISFCTRCKNYSLWIKDKMIYPNMSNAPLPIEEMPDDVKEVFIEARNIVNLSPRGACALLRLALQLLMPHLDEKGKDLNQDIANLVKKGLEVKI